MTAWIVIIVACSLPGLLEFLGSGWDTANKRRKKRKF